jgi:hypothetical protein
MGNAIIHFDTLAETHSELVETAIDIWLMLGQAGRFIPRLLEHNVVWTQSEKKWFDDLKSEDEAMQYVFEYVMPNSYKPHPRIKAFAEEHKFSHSLAISSWSDQTLRSMAKIIRDSTD